MSIAKMKIGLDGNLPPITSCVKDVKDIVNLIKIIKIPDDKVKDSEPLYTLVWDGPDDSDSEKSEEETWDEDDISNFQLSVERTEVSDLNTDNANKANTIDIVDKHILDNGEFVRKNNRNVRHRTKYNPNQKKINSVRRNFNSSGILLNRSMQNASNMEEDNYFNRSFGSQDNYGRGYNQPGPSVCDINPWVTPPSAMNMHPSFMCINYAPPPPPYIPAIASIPNLPISAVDNHRKSIGLLGEAPPNFQPQITPNYLPPRCPPNYNEYPDFHVDNFRGFPRSMPRAPNRQNYGGRRNTHWNNKNKPNKNNSKQNKNNFGKNWNRQHSSQQRNSARYSESNYRSKHRNYRNPPRFDKGPDVSPKKKGLSDT